MYQNDLSCFSIQSDSLCLFIWELSPLILRDINDKILLLFLLVVVVVVVVLVMVGHVYFPPFLFSFCLIELLIFCLFVDVFIFLGLGFLLVLSIELCLRIDTV